MKEKNLENILSSLNVLLVPGKFQKFINKELLDTPSILEDKVSENILKYLIAPIFETARILTYGSLGYYLYKFY